MSEASDRKAMADAMGGWDEMDLSEAALYLNRGVDDVLMGVRYGRLPTKGPFRIHEPAAATFHPFDVAAFRLADMVGLTTAEYRAAHMGLLPSHVVPELEEWRRTCPAQWAIPEPSVHGFVYIIEAPEVARVKIGWSSNPSLRLTRIGLVSPVALRLRSSWLAVRQDEPRLHDSLADLRVHGEWFWAEAAPRAESMLRHWGREEAR